MLTGGEKQVYTATAGIEVFGIKGYKIALSYKSEIKRLTGTIDYSGTILGVLDPIITLAYEDGHLYIDAWPFKKDGEEKDKNFLQKAIREGSKVVGCDKCGDLVELVLDKLIRTAFDFSLGKPRTGTDPMAGQNYVGSLKWSYVVYVTVPGVGEKEIARLNMDDVDLTIDKGFSADSIGEALLALLAQQVVNVGKALLHDPAKFAALIALMNMKGAAAKVLNGLLCRRVDEENVKEEAEKTVNERQGEPDETAGATEAAFTAVVSATSFVAAAVTFGEGVLAFAGFLGLGILFGPSASLASHLLPLLDPSKRDPIQAMIKAYGDHQTACQAAQNEAKVHLRDIARLSAVPAARWTTDTPTEAALSVDWSAALPKPPANVPADYFGDFKTFTWQLAYSTDSDPNAAKGVTVLPAAVHDDKTWGPVADPMFLTQRSVYIWVRANFTLNGETVLADWSPTGSPLTHPLWHPTPAGLVVSTGNAPAYDHVAVAITAPGAAPTRYQVAFAADEQTAATAPAYQKESADGSGCFTTPVLDLTLEPKDVGLLKGFVRQLSADKTQFHDSPWTASDGGLQIMQEDLVVTIEQAGFECLLEWNGSGTAAAAFAYVVTQRDGSVIIPLKAIEEPASVTSRIRMRLGSPEFKDGAAINFAVRRIPAGPNILQVFTRQSFTFQAMISITADSFFDAEAQNLELYVNSITPLSVGQVATVTLYSASSSQPYTAEIEFFDNTKMLGKVTSVPVKSPFLLKVDVTVQPNPQQAVLKSSQWDFPDQIDAPSASDFHTYFDTSLTAYWAVSSTAAAASCRMDLVSNDLSPLVKGKDLPAGDFAGGKYTVALFGTDLDGLQGNKKAKIQIWCTSAKGRTFKSKEKTCWLPDLTQWTAPERAANPANVAPRSSLTAMSAPLVDATGAVWWLNSNSSAVKGAARTPPDTWAAFTAATAKTAPLAGGSCVASCSRAANHLEVFWIDRWGGIQGAWRLRSRKFQQPTDYKTQGRGTATTARGGSLVAASCARGTMDIWFVAPDGRVRSSHFDNHSGWGELTTVANAGAADASNTALSSLALCTRADGSGAVELFWIQGQTLQNRRCRDTRAGDAYDAQAVVPAAGADPPAPGSTPCAVDAGNRGTFVAWITASGAVRAAVRQADSGGPLPAWTAAWTVAPAHAASPRSRICSGVAVSAFSGGAGRPAALGNLYWVGEDGRVTIAEFASEASPARLSLEYWAAYKHMVNIGWRTGVDSRAEIVAEDLDRAGAVRLFWVGGDSYVSTMRWPKLL